MSAKHMVRGEIFAVKVRVKVRLRVRVRAKTRVRVNSKTEICRNINKIIVPRCSLRVVVPRC